MIKKILSILVIVSMIGFSTAYAHEGEDESQAAGVAIVGVLALVTAAVLLSSHDRHEAYRPAPKQVSERACDSRYNGGYRSHDDRYSDRNYDHDNRYKGHHDSRYQGKGNGEGNGKRW